MDQKLSAIIVDDFEMSRLGMRHMLAGISCIESVREAANSKELNSLMKDEEPDLIFMDIQLGDEFGVELTRNILAKYPDTYVLAVTSSKEVQHFLEMMEAGAAAFILKNITNKELEKAICEVVRGNMYFSKEFIDVAGKMISRQSKITKVKLSDREKEVLTLICKGNSNQEIAEILGLSSHTIDSQRKKLITKIGARNTASMIMIAIRDGLIELN